MFPPHKKIVPIILVPLGSESARDHRGVKSSPRKYNNTVSIFVFALFRAFTMVAHRAPKIMISRKSTFGPKDPAPSAAAGAAAAAAAGSLRDLKNPQRVLRKSKES